VVYLCLPVLYLWHTRGPHRLWHVPGVLQVAEAAGYVPRATCTCHYCGWSLTESPAWASTWSATKSPRVQPLPSPAVAASNLQSQGFKIDPGAPYNWSSDAAQIRVLKDSKMFGVNVFEAVSYSPPWWMTKSGTPCYSTVWYCMVRYTTLHYTELQYSAVQCSTVQCSAVQCSAVQCSAVSHR